MIVNDHGDSVYISIEKKDIAKIIKEQGLNPDDYIVANITSYASNISVSLDLRKRDF